MRFNVNKPVVLSNIRNHLLAQLNVITNTFDGDVGVVVAMEYEEVVIGAIVDEKPPIFGFIMGPASKKIKIK